MTKFIACSLLVFGIMQSPRAAELRVRGIELTETGSVITVDCGPTAADGTSIQLHYPGVTRPFSSERDYYQNSHRTAIGFNMKPAAGVNEIYLIVSDQIGLRILPRINSALQAALSRSGVNTVSDALYLSAIEGDLIRVFYDPYGYEQGKAGKMYTFRLRPNGEFQPAK